MLLVNLQSGLLHANAGTLHRSCFLLFYFYFWGDIYNKSKSVVAATVPSALVDGPYSIAIDLSSSLM